MTMTIERRLPIDLAVRRSYLYAWESRAVFARPYAIYAVVTIVAELLLLAISGHGSKLAEYGLTAAEELFALAFAVGVSRYVLLGEVRSGLGFFRFDRHLAQYVRMVLLLLFLTIVAALPGLMVAGAVAEGTDAGTRGSAALIATGITVLAAVVISRLMPALPAAALGEPMPMRAIWDATRGNGARIFVAILLTALPFMVIEGVLIQFVPSPPPDGVQPVTFAEVLVTVTIGLISPMQTIVCTIMLSLCYDALVRGGGPSAK